MKIKKLLIPALMALTIGITACGDDDKDILPIPVAPDQTTPIDTTTTDTSQQKTNTQILAKKWIVDKAYVNGSNPDNSSKGLTLDVRNDGTYTLSTGYVGTWIFEANETKINWDKGTQFNQVFTLTEFTETKIDATFISAFTGQNARWVMIPN